MAPLRASPSATVQPVLYAFVGTTSQLLLPELDKYLLMHSSLRNIQSFLVREPGPFDYCFENGHSPETDHGEGRSVGRETTSTNVQVVP